MMFKLNGDNIVDGVYFPDGYHLAIDYGYIEVDGKYRSFGSKFTQPYRRCKLEDKEGNLISEFVEKNPEMIPEEILDIVYPNRHEYPSTGGLV